MNTKAIVAISVVVVLVLGSLFFVRTYTSSPGYTTAEMYQEFMANKPTCYGIDILLNREATYADAPGRSLCIGFLQ